MISLSSSTGINLLKKNFSKILERIDNRLMGLYDPSSASGLPGLAMTMISAHFYCVGKWPSLSL